MAKQSAGPKNYNAALCLGLAIKKRDKRFGQAALGDVLNEVWEILDPYHCHAGFNTWLAERAIRAVCEEIKRKGELPCHLHVSFDHPHEPPTITFEGPRWVRFATFRN